MQDLWRSKIEWDGPLPNSLLSRWRSIYESLVHLNYVDIPRWIKSRIVSWNFTDFRMHQILRTPLPFICESHRPLKRFLCRFLRVNQRSRPSLRSQSLVSSSLPQSFSPGLLHSFKPHSVSERYRVPAGRTQRSFWRGCNLIHHDGKRSSQTAFTRSSRNYRPPYGVMFLQQAIPPIVRRAVCLGMRSAIIRCGGTDHPGSSSPPQNGQRNQRPSLPNFPSRRTAPLISLPSRAIRSI